MAAIRKTKKYGSSAEVWGQISQEGSVCGSEISSIYIPMANEEALNDLPSNLSDIIKKANELKMSGGIHSFVLDSREELMDLANERASKTNSDYNLAIEEIPLADEHLVNALQNHVRHYTSIMPRILSLVELETNSVPDEVKDQNEEELLKAYKELELEKQKNLTI